MQRRELAERMVAEAESVVQGPAPAPALEDGVPENAQAKERGDTEVMSVLS